MSALSEESEAMWRLVCLMLPDTALNYERDAVHERLMKDVAYRCLVEALVDRGAFEERQES